MILQLYNNIGTSRHGDEIELADAPIPRIGEWLQFDKDEAGGPHGIYRVVSVDYTIRSGKFVPSVAAHEASEQHYEMAKTAIHDQHSNQMTDLRANPRA